jgi:ferritin-like metal-binding protein YciE
MSLVSSSHFSLVRARKALESAFRDNDWDQLRNLDQALGDSMNQAFEDDQRDTKNLVKELEKVLYLYAQMVSTLPDAAKQKVVAPNCNSDK